MSDKWCGSVECTKSHDNWDCVLCDEKFNDAGDMMSHMKSFHRMASGRCVTYDHKNNMPCLVTKNKDIAEAIRREWK